MLEEGKYSIVTRHQCLLFLGSSRSFCFAFPFPLFPSFPIYFIYFDYAYHLQFWGPPDKDKRHCNDYCAVLRGSARLPAPLIVPVEVGRR